MRTTLLIMLAFVVAALVVGAALNAAAEGAGEISPRVPGAGPADGRMLGVAVTQASNEEYPAALEVARSAGMQVLGLPLKWSDLETRPGQFGGDPDFLSIAAQSYPPVGIGVALELNPIDTTAVCVPADLVGVAWDDPRMIARLTAATEWVLANVGDLKVASLAIGNEVDVTLTTADDVSAYGRLLKAVAVRARELRPDIPVGVKTTFGGLTGAVSEEVAALHGIGNVSLITYYPLNEDFTVRPPSTVKTDFDLMRERLPDGPIQIVEIGYPSGRESGGSPEAQAAFVRNAFTEWDEHSDRFRLLMFTWLTDLSPATVDELVGYYAVPNPAFRSYLATLGLRESDGRPKPGYTALRSEAERRGW